MGQVAAADPAQEPSQLPAVFHRIGLWGHEELHLKDYGSGSKGHAKHILTMTSMDSESILLHFKSQPACSLGEISGWTLPLAVGQPRHLRHMLHSQPSTQRGLALKQV